MRKLSVVALLSATALAVGACGSGEDAASSGEIKGEITVLTNRTDLVDNVFNGYKKTFEAKYPGTTVTFDLKQEGEWTIILFAHEGWREQVEFMNHCSTKWALFLMSLKSLVETGTGAPHPHDVRISNWH